VSELRVPGAEKLMCGQCGDWLRLEDVEGHLASEGRQFEETILEIVEKHQPAYPGDLGHDIRRAIAHTDAQRTNDFSDAEIERHFRAYKIARRLAHAIETGDRPAVLTEIDALVALVQEAA
jgi:hypothetical protein